MKKAIIIGGTSGIGYGLANTLLANNYKVAITGVQKNIIEDLNKKKREHLKITYLDCKEKDASNAIPNLIEWLGGLDLLVFSAGIGNLNKDLGYTVENEANLLNILGFTEITDWSYRYFLKQGYGHYVAISSLSGIFGSRVAPAYHAAKAYQINYLEGLCQKANKSGKPIYITDVRPGFVDTPITEGKKTFWSSSTEKAGKQIFSLIRRKKSVGYISRRWGIIACFIKIVPRCIRNII